MENLKEYLSLNEDPCESAKVWAAKKTYNSPVELVRLACISWRSWVACYTTSKELLAALGEDLDWWVRLDVAENKNTPQEAFESLCNDEDWRVRSAVALNENAPKEILV